MKPDLFLSPDGFLVLGAKCKQLPVIHDINFLHYPKDSKWLTSKYYNYYFPRFAKAATRVATVSEFSKQEIAAHYKIDPAKIDVVYNGIHSFFRPLSESEKQETKNKFSYGKDYFVNIGALHPRKNIPTLIKAFSLFKKESGSDMKLMLAGPGFWGLGEIHKVAQESGVKEDIIFTGRLNDEDLAMVLGSATALTFIPYYEGFGIPVVEAMEAQVPVITSKVSSLPEIAGEASLLVDPKNPEEVKNAMMRLYKEQALREELISKGKAQKQNFSWDKSADLLWSSIVKAINS